jgi:hypothetical protein
VCVCVDARTLGDLTCRSFFGAELLRHKAGTRGLDASIAFGEGLPRVKADSVRARPAVLLVSLGATTCCRPAVSAVWNCNYVLQLRARNCNYVLSTCSLCLVLCVTRARCTAIEPSHRRQVCATTQPNTCTKRSMQRPNPTRARHRLVSGGRQMCIEYSGITTLL